MTTAKAPVTPPAGTETVSVKLINPVNFGPAILKRFMAPDVPGLDGFKDSPSFSGTTEPLNAVKVPLNPRRGAYRRT